MKLLAMTCCIFLLPAVKGGGPGPTCLNIVLATGSKIEYDTDEVETGRRAVGTKATYSCALGYLLEGGPNPRSCDAGGSWSCNPPVCTRILCNPLSNPSNGSLSLPSLVYNAAAHYACNSGYSLVGLSHRRCLGFGVWSGETPTCQVVDCGMVSSPANGGLSVSGTTFLSMAAYSCNPGFYLVGDSRRICEATGVWSGDDPSCQVSPCNTTIKCMDLEATGPTTVVYDPDTVVSGGRAVGTAARYSCTSGHELGGGANPRSCQMDGSWSGTPPSCTPINCGSISSPTNGGLAVTGTTYQSVATFSCTSGFSLVGDAERTCGQDGVWSGAAPSCQATIVKNCVGASPPQNGSVSSASTVPGSQAHFRCDGGFRLEGLSTLECRDDGTWTSAAPVCLLGRDSDDAGGSFNPTIVVAAALGGAALATIVSIGICVYKRRKYLNQRDELSSDVQDLSEAAPPKILLNRVHNLPPIIQHPTRQPPPVPRHQVDIPKSRLHKGKRSTPKKSSKLQSLTKRVHTSRGMPGPNPSQQVSPDPFVQSRSGQVSKASTTGKSYVYIDPVVGSDNSLAKQSHKEPGYESLQTEYIGMKVKK